jgi:hypothetical protein
MNECFAVMTPRDDVKFKGVVRDINFFFKIRWERRVIDVMIDVFFPVVSGVLSNDINVVE